MKTVLVTGCAGFVGSFTAKKFLESGFNVIGFDSKSNYYSIDLKNYRLNHLLQNKNFQFFEGNICDVGLLNKVFAKNEINTVVHLAAQAGVRLKLNQSSQYVDSNIQGFLNIINLSLNFKVQKFLYASSSSVYGDGAVIPYTESELNLKPTSIYGISKLANEKISLMLSKNSFMKFRGMRFFTVYGPEGRPDMAYFKLIASALTGIKFNLYGDGTVKRDFTFIDDIIESMFLLESELDKRENGFNDVVNIGGGNPISIAHLIEEVEDITKCKILLNRYPANEMDVKETCADFTYLSSLIQRKPSVVFRDGLARTVDWASNDSVRPKIKDWAESV
jgi:UDP-glucuronate 4-epimerase